MPEIPIVAMIERAGWLARTILLLLAAESVISWGVILNRLLFLAKTRKLNRLFRARYDKAGSITDAEKTDARLSASPLAATAKATAAEYRRILADAQSHTNVKDWSFFLETQFAMVNERLTSLASQLSSNLDKWAYILAIVSSSAPFIGLLGTVWGIMDAFFEIGNQGSASLPAVAPGIAEALTATAIALVVAIPAAIFYNIVLSRAQRAEDEIYEFKDLLIARLRREVLALLFGNRPGQAKTDPAPGR